MHTKGLQELRTAKLADSLCRDLMPLLRARLHHRFQAPSTPSSPLHDPLPGLAGGPSRAGGVAGPGSEPRRSAPLHGVYLAVGCLSSRTYLLFCLVGGLRVHVATVQSSREYVATYHLGPASIRGPPFLTFPFGQPHADVQRSRDYDLQRYLNHLITYIHLSPLFAAVPSFPSLLPFALRPVTSSAPSPRN